VTQPKSAQIKAGNTGANISISRHRGYSKKCSLLQQKININ